MAGGCIVYLNLDAELELADDDYTGPSAGMQREIEARAGTLRAAVERSCTASGFDTVSWLQPTLDGPSPASPAQGIAWCPTPRAIAALEAAGATITAPPVDVIRRVNHRRFAAELEIEEAGDLFGSFFTTDAELVTTRCGEGAWVLKRAFGFAGRQRKIIDASHPLDEAARTWIEASMTGQYGVGLRAEPLVERLFDISCHGIVPQQGSPQLFAPRIQKCDSAGRWLAGRSMIPNELREDWLELLLRNASAVGAALLDAGYFGPFSVDGFAYRDGERSQRLYTCSDINARYTMDWWNATVS